MTSILNKSNNNDKLNKESFPVVAPLPASRSELGTIAQFWVGQDDLFKAYACVRREPFTGNIEEDGKFTGWIHLNNVDR